MAKTRSKSRGRKTKIRTKATKTPKTTTNGVKAQANGNGSSGRVQTVTFRIPVQLKKSVEQAARSRGMTTTRFVVEALESEVNDEPPRWWRKAGVEERRATA